MPLVGQHCQSRIVTSTHQKAAHTNEDNAPGAPCINVLSFTGLLTAVLACCWSLTAKIVQKQRSRSSADVHGSSWVAPKLHQLSPRVCCAPRDKSPCTDLLDPTAMWDHLCSSSVPRHTRGDLLLPLPGGMRARGGQSPDHPTQGAGRHCISGNKTQN